MFKNAAVFVTFLLLSQLSISQDGYPKVTIIDGDTIVMLTTGQVDRANEEHVNLTECRKVWGVLEEQVEIGDSLFIAEVEVSESLRSQLSIMGQMNSERGGIIEQLQIDLKKAHRKIKFQKLQKYLLLTGGLVGGYFLSKTLAL